MLLKISGVELPCYPATFSVSIMDIDNSESSQRTADGTLTRDRIAVKRQIEMSWGVMEWDEIADTLSLMSEVFFDFYYPDPMTGAYETKTFYAGNRPAPFAVSNGNSIKWSGLKVTLIEK
jgi:hypothetical protein